MNTMTKVSVSMISACLITASAQAQQVMSYFEQTISIQFVDGGLPGRSVSDVIFYRTQLFDDSGKVAATKAGSCLTQYQLPNSDFGGTCMEMISFKNGKLFTYGDFNQSAFERFEPQSLNILNGTGRFARASGVENLLQVRYPDQAQVTFVID